MEAWHECAPVADIAAIERETATREHATRYEGHDVAERTKHVAADISSVEHMPVAVEQAINEHAVSAGEHTICSERRRVITVERDVTTSVE